jgi:hypothetical protein
MQYGFPTIKVLSISFKKLSFWRKMFFENLGYLKIIQLMLKLLRNYDIIIIINNYVIAIHVYFF